VTHAAPRNEAATWRLALAGPIVAAVTIVVSVLATRAAGVQFADWEHAIAQRLLRMAGAVAALVALDIVVRAAWRAGRRPPSLAALRRVQQERWPLPRVVAVASALVSFYVTYLGYRNLKSVVPVLRPETFDGQLADWDRALFAGNDPAAILHTVLGTGISAEILAVVYMAFFYFVLASLALALVFVRPRAGIFYVTALSLNWGLGAASYFVFPSLGPIYAEPSAFADLPSTRAGGLQDVLLRQRLEFLRDPAAAGVHQGIGAFASLHTSIVFTAAVAAHLLGLDRRLKIGLWALFGLTTLATIYLGWHYVLDDVAGLVIALAALALAAALTDFKLGIAWRPQVLRRARAAKRRAAAQAAQAAQAGQPVPSKRPVAETTSGSDSA
jgi:membrane-associated phospholipid phosphatase